MDREYGEATIYLQGFYTKTELEDAIKLLNLSDMRSDELKRDMEKVILDEEK